MERLVVDHSGAVTVSLGTQRLRRAVMAENTFLSQAVFFQDRRPEALRTQSALFGLCTAF